MSSGQGKKKNVFLKRCVPIVLVIAVGSAGYMYYNNASPQQVMAQNTIDLMNLSKQDVTNSLSASGTIYSNSTKDVTSLISGTIVEILADIGDKVEEGQTLAILNTTDIENKITELESSINSNVNSLSNSIITNELSVQSSNISLIQQQDSYNKILNEIYELENEIDEDDADDDQTVSSLSSAIDSLEKSLENLEDTLEDVQRSYDLEKESYDKQVILYSNGIISRADYDNSVNSFTNMELSLASAIKNYNDGVEDLAEAIVDYDEAVIEYYEDKAENKEDTLETLYENLGDAALSVENAQINLTKSVEALNQYTNGTSNTDLSIESSKLELASQYEDLENSIIVSPMSGTITATTATVGSTATGALFSIEDTEDLYVEVTVTESDLAEVVVGQKATVSTEATGYEVFEGEVTYISPKSTGGGDGSMAEYSVYITISNPNTNLIKLGMNGFANIITESSSSTFAVPYDVLVQNQGSISIYILENDTVVAIPITLGVQSDNVVEVISNDLREGMSIIIEPSLVTVGETLDGSSGAVVGSNSQNQNASGMTGDMPMRSEGEMPEGVNAEMMQERMQQRSEGGNTGMGGR